MINTGQLNETIDELEKEIHNIKSISKVYEELNKLSSEVKVNKGTHNVIVKDLADVSRKFDATSAAFINATDKFSKTSDDIKLSLNKNICDIVEENKTVAKELVDGYRKYETNITQNIHDINTSLNKQYKAFEENINLELNEMNVQFVEKMGQIEKIIVENADNFSKDISNQLDKNEKKMCTEVKNINYDIHNSLMNYINSRIESVESKLTIKQKEEQANAKMLKILIVISILLSTLCVVLLLAK